MLLRTPPRASSSLAIRARRYCAALDAFSERMEAGLGVFGRLHAQQEAICSGLARRGWFALDGLLDAEDAALVRSEANAMYRGGEFSLSYSFVEETGEKLWRPNVHMKELDGESWRAAPTLVVLLSELMGALPAVVNDGFAPGSPLSSPEHQPPLLSSTIFGHKLAVSVAEEACYPKHLDNVTGGADKRKLTAVYYPNAGWDAEARGGCIRLFDALEPPTYTDVAPAGEGGADRVLLFWSDLLVHEVLPMRVPPGQPADDDDAHHRHTFTLWLTTENDASLLDERSPLYRLRVEHYPDKRE